MKMFPLLTQFTPIWLHLDHERPAADSPERRPVRTLNEILQSIPRGASSFFEESSHLAFLAETVVSDLKAGATLGRSRHVRIWSAACATGEEAYSIAICLLEALRSADDPTPATYQPGGWRIDVLGSDADPVMLSTATDRVYDESSLAQTPVDLRARYFLRGRGEMSGRVRVKQGLAQLVHFQRLRLETRPWPVEGKFDAIFFRNALDTYSPETAERILRDLLSHLNPHAYLILGASERAPSLKGALVSLGNGIHQLRPHGKARYTGKERRIFLRTQRPPK
jgi:chemotaxis protein methyltransferase CheR